MIVDHGHRVLGFPEMAELLGVSKTTPYLWWHRGLLPDPDYLSVNGNRAWDRETIVQWAALTGRLPPELAEEGVRLVERSVRLPVRRGGREAKALIARANERRRARLARRLSDGDDGESDGFCGFGVGEL